jgi:hypothetical protein
MNKHDTHCQCVICDKRNLLQTINEYKDAERRAVKLHGEALRTIESLQAKVYRLMKALEENGLIIEEEDSFLQMKRTRREDDLNWHRETHPELEKDDE